MSFSVVTNISSLSGQAQLDKTNYGLQQTLAGLTSGLPINTAADDAAGLAVANRFRMDNAGLQVGIRAGNDAISRLQIEDGTASNISQLLDSKILEGSTQLQIAPLEEAIKLLTILLAGWEEAAKKADLAVPTTLLAGQAANTGRFRLHA